MKYEIFKLHNHFINLPGTYEATLTAYCPDVLPTSDGERHRTSLIICPGGGYVHLSDREAEPVALRFLPMGYNVFVLRYSIAPAKYPEALLQAAASVAFVRAHAQQFHADPEKIVIGGFSAGGHLAASLGVFWKEPFIAKTLGIDSTAARPDGMILCYPVITMGKFAHRGSVEALLGKDASKDLKDKMSLEKQVSKDVPPAFLWHTFEDGAVPVQNTLMFAQALRENDIPFELHIYPKGSHGLSLCNSETSTRPDQINPHCATWADLCGQWLQLTFGK